MTETINVYGFGSYFSGSKSPRDVDLLLVHQSVAKGSCNYAISCKTLILQKIPEAHVTVLSLQEECRIDFIKQSESVDLGLIRELSTKVDIDSICEAIDSYANASGKKGKASFASSELQ